MVLWEHEHQYSRCPPKLLEDLIPLCPLSCQPMWVRGEIVLGLAFPLSPESGSAELQIKERGGKEALVPRVSRSHPGAVATVP